MKLSFFPLPVLAFALAAGCAGSQEEGGVPRANRSELATTEAGYFVVVRSDDRALHVARVGAAKTPCADRVSRDTCEVTELDLSRADLSADDELVARARVSDGAAIVFAKLVSGAADDPRAGRLVASEVWLRDVAAPSLAEQRTATDAMFVLRDVHEGCESAWLRAEPIGGGRATHFATLDLAAVGGALSDGERSALGEGRLLARGAAVGKAFVAVGLYSRFPGSPRPAAPAAIGEGADLR